MTSIDEVQQAEAAVQQAEIVLLEARLAEAEADLEKAKAAHATATQLAVMEAQSVIATAKADQDAARRSELVKQLREVRTQLRTLTPKLATMRRAVLDGQAQQDNLLRAIQNREDRVNELHAAAPVVVGILDDDPDVVQWNSALALAETELGSLQNSLHALPNLMTMRIEGVELATQIQTLTFAEHNLLNALDNLKRSTPRATWGGKQVDLGGTLSGVH